MVTVRAHRWLGGGLVVLGLGLAANALLGPLAAGVIRYPLAQTLLYQTIGLEAMSLAIVAPLSIVAGVLVLRGRSAGAVLGFGPAAYVWYMFLQYVLGPEYTYYPGALALHLGLFALSGVVAVAAWAAIDPAALPPTSTRTDRRRAAALLGLAAFLLLRYVPMAADAAADAGLTAEARAGVTMFWSIVLLDLGIVLPATVATAVGLLRAQPWAHRALYALLGWWALVPASVAAMSIVMVVNGDPYAAAGQAVLLTVAALAFAALVVVVYRPLLARHGRGAQRPAGPAVPAAIRAPVPAGSGARTRGARTSEQA